MSNVHVASVDVAVVGRRQRRRVVARESRHPSSSGGSRSMTPEPNYTVVEGPDGSRAVQIHARGMAVLDDPQVNRGTAFTMDERDHLGLHGLLPSGLETIERAGGPLLRAVQAKRLGRREVGVPHPAARQQRGAVLPAGGRARRTRCCRSSTPRPWGRRSRSSATCSAARAASSSTSRTSTASTGPWTPPGSDRTTSTSSSPPTPRRSSASATGASAASTSRSASSRSTPSPPASTRAGCWPSAWTSAPTVSRC